MRKTRLIRVETANAQADPRTKATMTLRISKVTTALARLMLATPRSRKSAPSTIRYRTPRVDSFEMALPARRSSRVTRCRMLDKEATEIAWERTPILLCA